MSSLVRVLNVSGVLPDQAINAPPHADHHAIKLSFLDCIHVPTMPIQRLFFFEGPGLPPLPSLVRSLRSSLAATLVDFLPLAGKLTYRPASSANVVIDCSPVAISAGVKFVEAEYAGSILDMHRLASDDEHHTEAFMQLVPELEVGRLPAPVLAVQVTRPDDVAGDYHAGAVAVGVSIHHAVADGQSVWQFMKAWAAASRGGSPSAELGLVPPTFDRALIRHPKADELAHRFLDMFATELPVVKPHPAPDMTRLSRRTFWLRADQIRSLKQRIEQLPKPPSSYVAVSSLVWTSIVRAKPLNHADDAYFLLSADCRRRLRPPVDEGYFGNCVTMCIARASVGELRGGDGLVQAAVAIQREIREQLVDPLSDTDGLLELYAGLPKERLTTAGSSNRFMAYETDFGWGAPSRVELVSAFSSEMVMLLGAADGGVQVSVVLDRAYMEAFAANFQRHVSST